MAFASDSTTAPAVQAALLPLDRRAIGRDGWARARDLAARLGGEIRDHIAEGMRQAWAAARGLFQIAASASAPSDASALASESASAASASDRPAQSRSVDQIGGSDLVPSYPDMAGVVPPLLPAPAPLPSLTAALSRRRTIFGGLALAAAPVAALPAVAAEPSLDADLLALAPVWQASAEHCDRARKAVQRAAACTPEILPPEALFLRTDDHTVFRTAAGRYQDSDKKWFSVHSLRWLEPFSFSACDEATRSRLFARRDEIMAAHTAWSDEIASVEAAAGYTAADEKEKAATEVQCELRRRIMLTPAHTMAGVLFKARVVAWCFDSASEIRREVALNVEAGSSAGEDMALSLAGDLVAMLERGAPLGVSL